VRVLKKLNFQALIFLYFSLVIATNAFLITLTLVNHYTGQLILVQYKFSTINHEILN